MHFLTLLTYVLLVTLTSADNTTSNITLSTSGVVLSTVSSLFASTYPLHPPLLPKASHPPLSHPSWELRNRASRLKVANGHPLRLPTITPPQHLTSAPQPATTMPPPTPALPKRQVPIPYIPSDWTTRVECPVLQGMPCITVSEYLPWLRGKEHEAAEEKAQEAARVSALVESGAWVPGMDVTAPSGVDKVFSYMLAVACTVMIYAVLVL